ncbi:uncharacterized protein LOC123719015 [Pieris brassicae]|uniref:uncharacterized protein LOC123719015 n=1 Tax=Pieris brassicae TaxID=7116 RepID=UPI001E65E436|nr:uncharacterized protein LOC123719015 [Pieris brassicae]
MFVIIAIDLIRDFNCISIRNSSFRLKPHFNMFAYLFIAYVSFIYLQTTECLPRVVYLVRSDNNDFTKKIQADTWNFDGKNDKDLKMLAKRDDSGNDRDVLDEIDYHVKYSDVFGDENTFRTEKTSKSVNVFEDEKYLNEDRDLFKNEVNGERKDLFVRKDLKYSDILAKAFDYNGGNVETKKGKFETDKDGADLFKNEYEFDNYIGDVIRVRNNKNYKNKNQGLVIDINDKEKLFLGKNLFKIIRDVGTKLGKQIAKGIEYAVNSITQASFQATPGIIYEEVKGRS